MTWPWLVTSTLHSRYYQHQEHVGKVGLWISHEKTKAMITRLDQHHLPLSLGEHNIKYVENLLHLGSKSLTQMWRKICRWELPMLDCEMWMTASIINMLAVFHHWWLRIIVRNSQWDHITNDEVMRRAGPQLFDMVTERRPKKMWRYTFKEDLIEMTSAGTVEWGSPVDRADGGKLLPNVPVGTGGTKSK